MQLSVAESCSCKILREIETMLFHASAQAPPDPRVSLTSVWCRRCFSTVSSVPASVARWMDRMAAFSIRSSVWTLCISLSSKLCASLPDMSPLCLHYVSIMSPLCPHVYVITMSSLRCPYVVHILSISQHIISVSHLRICWQ